jgi:hypothetical protein
VRPSSLAIAVGLGLLIGLLVGAPAPVHGADWTVATRVTRIDGSQLTSLHEAATGGAALHLVHPRIGQGDRDDRLVYQRSTDGGATWSRERALFEATRRDPDLVANLAIDAQGRSVIVAWRARGPTGTRLFVRLSRDAGGSWGPSTVLASTPRVRGLGVPAVTVEGRTLIVAWTERADGSIHVRRSTDAGSTWGPVRTLGRSLLSITCSGDPLTDGLVGLASSGRLVHLAWSGGHQGDCLASTIVVRTSRDGGRTWEAARTATETRTYGWPELAANEARLLLSLQRPEGGIVVVRSADGGRSFAETRIDAPEDDRAIGAADVLLPGGATAWVVYADITYDGDRVAESRVRFRASSDGGARWGVAGTIVPEARKLRQAGNLLVSGGRPVVVFQSSRVDDSDPDILVPRAR